MFEPELIVLSQRHRSAETQRLYNREYLIDMAKKAHSKLDRKTLLGRRRRMPRLQIIVYGDSTNKDPFLTTKRRHA